MMISAVAAVLSSIFLTLIFPLSFARMIDAIKLSVVDPYGISEIISVLESTLAILALTRTFPPRKPSL